MYFIRRYFLQTRYIEKIMDKQTADKIKSVITNNLPSVDFIQSVSNEIFIHSENWKTFENIETDLDVLNQIEELKNCELNICCYDINNNTVYIQDMYCGLGEDFDEILRDENCRIFEPDFDKEKLEEFIEEQKKHIEDLESGKDDDDVSPDRFKNFINEQTFAYNQMLERYNNLKDNQVLIFLDEPGNYYPEYSCWSIMEISEIKMVDVLDCNNRTDAKDGFNLKLGVCIKTK